MNEHAVLVFSNQSLSREAQLSLSQQLGQVEVTANPSARLGSSLMSDISNLGDNDEVLELHAQRRLFGLANRLWHTDSSFYDIPAKYSLLYAIRLPETGGYTEFADMRQAAEALPATQRSALSTKVGCHSLARSREILGVPLDADRAQWPWALHPLLHRHQGSQRISLFLASHLSHFTDGSLADDRMLILDLMEWATQKQWVYQHSWCVGDLLVWDNRATMHRGRPFPDHQIRELRRTTLTNSVKLTPLDHHDNHLEHSFNVASA
jgi:alpha-ketoglutarate-dependent 2,4-dichlorophenoxyacetate dioxygenase